MSPSLECDLNKQDVDIKGSSMPDEPHFVCIGKIHRSHGIQGEVVFLPLTDFPERIRRGKRVYISEEHIPAVIQSVRKKPPFLLIHFDLFSDERQTEWTKNKFVYVSVQDLPELPAGEYYFHQLIGLDVVSPDQVHVGILREILETGANDVYVIQRDNGKEELIPAIPQFVKKILIDEKKIIIEMPEWI